MDGGNVDGAGRTCRVTPKFGTEVFPDKRRRVRDRTDQVTTGIRNEHAVDSRV